MFVLLCAGLEKIDGKKEVRREGTKQRRGMRLQEGIRCTQGYSSNGREEDATEKVRAVEKDEAADRETTVAVLGCRVAISRKGENLRAGAEMGLRDAKGTRGKV